MEKPIIPIVSYKDYGFEEILNDFENSKVIDIITFNISKKSNKLLNKLKSLKNKQIRILTNIPNRWENYFPGNSKKIASTTIKTYLKNLEPSSFSSDVEIYFNFQNHSKLYSTDNYTYIGSQNFSDESKNNFEIGVILEEHMDTIEELIYYDEETIRFYGIQIEELKERLTLKIKEVENLKNSFNLNLDIGYDFVGDVKERFEEITTFLEKIKHLIDDINSEINVTKKDFPDNELISDMERATEDIFENINNLKYDISKDGNYPNIYRDFNQEILDNVWDADEEHLQSAIEREQDFSDDEKDNIKESYEEDIDNFLRNFDTNIIDLQDLQKTVEELSSNRKTIDNTI